MKTQMLRIAMKMVSGSLHHKAQPYDTSPSHIHLAVSFEPSATGIVRSITFLNALALSLFRN